MSRVPVIAVTPNFNKAGFLPELLPRLLSQDYAGVWVVDDNSSDESKEVLNGFGKDIKVVYGRENLGPAGNRNRILDRIEDVLIHFIDTDMDSVSPTPAEVINDSYRPGIGYLGGLVRDEKGRQAFFNYGPDFSLRGNFGLMLQALAYGMYDSRPGLAQKLIERARDWPDPKNIAAKKVGWATEGNLAIYSEVMRRAGGFDQRLRFYESQDLALRLRERGLAQYFEPELETIHRGESQTGLRQAVTIAKATKLMLAKHGVVRFLAG